MLLQAGTSKVDVTPNYGSPTRRWPVAGSGSRIEDIRWPLYARTVALSDGATLTTMTSIEVACLYKCHLDEIRRLVRQLSPVPIDHIVLHLTHQHSDSFIEYESAYDVFGINDVMFDMAYVGSLARRVATSICLAVQRMVPVSYGYEAGLIEEGIASCRRPIGPDGKLAWRSSRPASLEARALPRGHIDPEVGVLALRGADGAPVATLYNYACHPSAAGGDSPSVISADYPGFASDMIERQYGGLALFLHGCSGDINPGKYVRGDATNFDDRIADARRMGQILAGETLKILGRIVPRQAARLMVAARETALPVQAAAGDVDAALVAAKQALDDWRLQGRDPRTALRLYVMARKIVAGACPVVLFALALDDLRVVFLPGEPFTELGEQIKSANPTGKTMIAATCGEDPFYMPTAEAYRQGGYETSYIATPETGASLVAHAADLLSECDSICRSRICRDDQDAWSCIIGGKGLEKG